MFARFCLIVVLLRHGCLIPRRGATVTDSRCARASSVDKMCLRSLSPRTPRARNNRLGVYHGEDSGCGGGMPWSIPPCTFTHPHLPTPSPAPPPPPRNSKQPPRDGATGTAGADCNAADSCHTNKPCGAAHYGATFRQPGYLAGWSSRFQFLGLHIRERYAFVVVTTS